MGARSGHTTCSSVRPSSSNQRPKLSTHTQYTYEKEERRFLRKASRYSRKDRVCVLGRIGFDQARGNRTKENSNSQLPFFYKVEYGTGAGVETQWQ